MCYIVFFYSAKNICKIPIKCDFTMEKAGKVVGIDTTGVVKKGYTSPPYRSWAFAGKKAPMTVTIYTKHQQPLFYQASHNFIILPSLPQFYYFTNRPTIFLFYHASHNFIILPSVLECLMHGIDK